MSTVRKREESKAVAWKERGASVAGPPLDYIQNKKEKKEKKIQRGYMCSRT